MAELNVTPLLDLAFVLLIIFIITTPLMESGVALDLPKASEHPTPPVDPKAIRTISVTRSGQIYLEQNMVTLPRLQQDLITFRETTPDAAVIVRADKGLPFQQVVDVYNVIQNAKIERMSLDTVAP